MIDSENSYVSRSQSHFPESGGKISRNPSSSGHGEPERIGGVSGLAS